jgi:creatinine amidohydrolase
MDTQLEYIYMKPQEMVKRRKACSVAYLPIGILEWHSLHLPLGTDGLTVSGMLLHCAREIGGIVFPALYWGDDRNILAETVFDPKVSDWLPEGYPDQTKAISEVYEIPTEQFRADGKRYLQSNGMKLWRDMVVRIFFQIETLGFDSIVVIAGHGPLEAPLAEATADYAAQGGLANILTLDKMNDRAAREGGPTLKYGPGPGEPEHAAKYETSMIQYLYPELVELDNLPANLSEGCIGSLGGDPRTTASAELGEKLIREVVELVRWSVTKA